MNRSFRHLNQLRSRPIKVLKRVADVEHECWPTKDGDVQRAFASGVTEAVWRCPTCGLRWGVRGRGRPEYGQAPARLTLFGYRYPL